MPARSQLIITLLAVGVGAVLLSQLGAYGLLEPDEGRYAEIGREMAAPGASWLTPTLNGVPHFQKPPMVYWLTAISFKLLGVSEVAARLPSALAALATLLLTAAIAGRLFAAAGVRRRAGLLAPMILASSPLFLFLGRTLTPDMLMTAWITAAIYCLLRCRSGGSSAIGGEAGRPRLWGWLFFVCLGCGFLSKGPVAFLVPVAAALGYALSLRRVRRSGGEVTGTGTRLRLPWAAGLPLALLIGLSWFLVMALKDADLAAYFVKYELLARFSSGAHGRTRPLWFFIPILLAGFLPWTFPALSLLPAAWRSRDRRPELGLFIGWIVVPLVVLSLSGSKLPTYVLPLFPGLAVALAGAIARPHAVDAGSGRLSWPLRLAMAAVPVALVAGLSIVPMFVLEPSQGLAPAAVFALVTVTVAAAAWTAFASRASGQAVVLSLGVILLSSWALYPSQLTSWNDLLRQQASVRSLAARIGEEEKSRLDGVGAGVDIAPARVVACEIRAHGLEFYLRRTVEITRGDADIVLPQREVDRHFPVIHERAADVARLESAPDGGAPGDAGPIYVVTRRGRFERSFATEGWNCLQSAGDFVLLRR